MTTDIATRSVERTEPYECVECGNTAWYFNCINGKTYCDEHRMLIEPVTLVRAIRYDT